MRARRRRSVAGLGVVSSSSPWGPTSPFRARLLGGVRDAISTAGRQGTSVGYRFAVALTLHFEEA